MNCGLVCSPYSVIQIGTRRWYHFSSDSPNCVIRVIVTFGHLTFCVGPRNGSVGYGCVAHASNFSFGSSFASRYAKLPGETESDWRADGLSRPRFEVSPTATSAFGLPALIPAYAAL